MNRFSTSFVLLSLAAATVAAVAPAAHAADPTPSPTMQEVPQPSACAQYSQHVPSFVYAGQSATMTVSIKGLQDNAHLTAVGSGSDGGPIAFDPASASAPASPSSDATVQVPFTFTPSDTSTVGITWTDHCGAEASGHQDRRGSTTPSTVRVVNSPPPPANYACGAPDIYAVTPDRPRIPAGGNVTLHVTVRQLPCYGEEKTPHDFTVVGRTPGQTSQYPYEVIGQGQTDEHGHADVVASPFHDTEYALLASYSQKSVVTVDRTAGTCAGKVTSSAPAAAALGSTVRLSGRAPAGYGVSLNLRRRGQTAFTQHQVTTDGAGNWTTTLRVDDDYRYYATTSACDSPLGLLRVRPTISAAATAHRAASVTLTVTGQPTAPVAVYFHKAGTTGYTKRRLSSLGKGGVYTTTFVADADYRYYAVVGNDRRQSNVGLTQVR